MIFVKVINLLLIENYFYFSEMQNDKVHLERRLGLLQATAINMIDMVGIGPFVVLPIVIQLMYGPWFIYAWIAGALLSLVDSLIWSELGAALPNAGGSFYFLRTAYGEKSWGKLMSFLYTWQTMIQAPLVIASGAIGSIEHIETAFTFTSEMTDNYRLNPLMGGGALLDVGCYQAHAWVALTEGAADMEIDNLARSIGPTGIDLTTDVSVRINKSVTAHAVSSFALPSQQQFIVRGSQGKMQTDVGESFTTWNEASSLRINDVVEEFAVTNAFVEMVENVSNVIRGEEGWIVPSTDSIRVAHILDSIARHR